MKQTSPVNFRVAKPHNYQVLKNPIHVYRLKPYIWRQLIPPKPDDIEKCLRVENNSDRQADRQTNDEAQDKGIGAKSLIWWRGQ
jgi:hypothetical protein